MRSKSDIDLNGVLRSKRIKGNTIRKEFYEIRSNRSSFFLKLLLNRKRTDEKWCQLFWAVDRNVITTIWSEKISVESGEFFFKSSWSKSLEQNMMSTSLRCWSKRFITIWFENYNITFNRSAFRIGRIFLTKSNLKDFFPIF